MRKRFILISTLIIASELICLSLTARAGESLNQAMIGMTTRGKVIYLSEFILNSSATAESRNPEEAINTIEEIEDHARILAKIFESKRGKSGYERRRMRLFKTLSKIGSENAIEVLIDYLDDTADALSLAEIRQETDVSLNGSNATLAAKALDHLNLPDAPMNKIHGSYLEDEVEVWRKWAKTRKEDQSNSQKSHSPEGRLK